MKIIFVVVVALLGNIACGVKGDPIPPKVPVELGRGQPTYKGATEDLAFPTVPPLYAPSTTKNSDVKKKNEDESKK